MRQKESRFRKRQQVAWMFCSPVDVAQAFSKKLRMELLASVGIVLSLDHDVGDDHHVELPAGRVLRGSMWS